MSETSGASQINAMRWSDGRFQALELLKQGLGVETYLGVDHQDHGKEVIIKTTTRDASPSALLRIEHEAEVLSHVKSPWLPPLLCLERRDDGIALITHFITGMTLEARLSRGPLGLFETLSIARCLLDALEEVHDQAVLHRDIKPANIILVDSGSVGDAVLIDFGFSRSSRLDVSIRDLPVGTVRYMSPEQTGLLSSPVEEASDLYSLGLVLFECLVGSPLYNGATAGEVLRQQLGVNVPELRSLGLNVPRVLDEILARMLHKSPRDRYQSAKAIQVDIRQLREALDSGVNDPSLVVGLYDRRGSLTAPTFVGRQVELDELAARLSQVKKGRGGIVVIEADSGGGKTRVLDEFAGQAAKAGTWVIRGQGLDQAGQKPLQALEGVVNELISRGEDPEFCRDFRNKIADQADALSTVLPELTALLGLQQVRSLGQEAHAEARSLAALSALFDALGDSKRSALIVFDDCQWIDEMTLKAIEVWSRQYSASRGVPNHVLLAVAYRSDEVSQGHRLRKLHPILHQKLPPFGPADVRNLAESMAGALPEEAVQLVIDFAEGSPFFTAAVLQGLVETGALVQDHLGWKVQPAALANVQSSRQAAAFLSRRLELLSPDVLLLLSSGAILGNRFDLNFATELAGLSPTQAMRSVREAQKKHIIWQQGAQHAFVHDKLREALLAKLEPARRQELHLSAARHLETRAPGKTFEVSFHFGAAGHPELALPYAIQAAGEARSQHALEIAEHHFRIAEQGLKDAPIETRHQVHEALGEVLMLRGRYDEALSAFDSAGKLAQGALAQAQLDAKIGELAFKRGDMRTATEALERGLRKLGSPVPGPTVAFLFYIPIEVMIQVLHTFVPSIFTQTRSLKGAESQLLKVRLYSRLTYCYFFKRGALPTLWSHLKELNLAEKYPPCKELGQAYSTHAPVMTMIPLFKRAISYGNKGLQVRRSIGDLWGEAQALHFYGAALYGASRYAEANEVFTEALRLLERTGDRWEINGCTYHLASCRYRMGDIKGAVEAARRAHEAGLAIGDSFASGASLSVWARATDGQIPQSAIAAELVRVSEDKQRNAEVLQAEGLRLYGNKEFTQAVEFLRKSRKLVLDAGLRTDYVASIPIWLATALRSEALAVPSLNPQARQSILKQAAKISAQGLRLARFYKNNLPHALRERASCLALLSQPKQAKMCLDESLAVAQKQGAQFEFIQSLSLRAQMGVAHGWKGAQEDLQQLKLAFESPSLEYLSHRIELVRDGSLPVTLSLLDRFDMIIDIGRQITGALTQGGIYSRVQYASSTLLRGDHCLIIEVGIKNPSLSSDFMVAVGDRRIKYSRQLVLRAVTERRPVRLDAEFGAGPSESALLSGARSALCAPISVRGVVSRCLYVTHHQVGELFGDEEEKLAGFIAALAGTALENAEGFTEIQELSSSLEKDIVEKVQAEEQLQASLKEKEVLLGEIYHRTKNNMQVISSLLSLQAQSITDPVVLSILRENQNRIRSMALVHEKLYQSKDLVNIRFKDYIQGLVQGLATSYVSTFSNVSLVTDLQEVQIGIDSAIPCGLIINELVTNSLKYAFPGNNTKSSDHLGKIEVILKWNDPEIHIVVRDNGIGIQGDIDFNKIRSLGLKLVKGLVEKQLMGSLDFNGISGTEFSIRFREAPKRIAGSYTAAPT